MIPRRCKTNYFQQRVRCVSFAAFVHKKSSACVSKTWLIVRMAPERLPKQSGRVRDRPHSRFPVRPQVFVFSGVRDTRAMLLNPPCPTFQPHLLHHNLRLFCLRTVSPMPERLQQAQKLHLINPGSLKHNASVFIAPRALRHERIIPLRHSL